MTSPLTPTEQLIAQTLQAGHALAVRWDCGGDESWVYTQLDGQELPFVYEPGFHLANALDTYLTEKLELPSAGEFSMQGTGRIFREGTEVLVEYQSQAYADTSWMDDMSDERLAEMGYARPDPATQATADEDDYPADESMSDHYTGRQVLFTLPA